MENKYFLQASAALHDIFQLCCCLLMRAGIGHGWHLIVSCCGAHSNPRRMQMGVFSLPINMMEQIGMVIMLQSGTFYMCTFKVDQLGDKRDWWSKLILSQHATSDSEWTAHWLFEILLPPALACARSSSGALNAPAGRSGAVKAPARLSSAKPVLARVGAAEPRSSSCQTDTLIHFSLPKNSSATNRLTSVMMGLYISPLTSKRSSNTAWTKNS